VHPVHHYPSIALLYLLRYSTAELPFIVDIQGKPHHHPRRTLWPTNCNTDPNPSKRAEVIVSSRTASKVKVVARSRTASVSSMHARHNSSLAGSLPHKSASLPTNEPSPCLVAGEDDDFTPCGSLPIWTGQNRTRLTLFRQSTSRQTPGPAALLYMHQATKWWMTRLQPQHPLRQR
jgi:hypothetical protein